ncbi:MAG TPA: BlaI/MecI/CopY family transcriptional regulator [Vicinamibacterales bacterium]|jgi:predicted transcriptional regulator|nr:BlaI/MecI/CopY family transcriptional regulator [Vicinamibacterales bacterium]
MARKATPTLTDAEARLMAVLWEREAATVADVLAAVRTKRPLTYSTVQTMMRILEEKGYAKHEKVGRAFIYRAVIDAKQARRRALKHLVSRLFDNSPSLLVLNVLEDEQIDPAELKQLKKLIEDA